MENKNNSEEKLVSSDLHPDIGIKWSRRLAIKIFIFSLLTAVLVIFGFLLYQEYLKPGVGEVALFNKQLTPGARAYTNDYWGFSFNYLGYWSQVIGSYEDGEYYFSSEPINFIQEQDADQALMEVRTFNSLKPTTFDQWFADEVENYFPRANISKQADFPVENGPAHRYYFSLNKPTATVGFWDMIVVSKADQKFYMFILETKDKKTHDDFQTDFETMVQSVHLYNGFGN